MPAGDGTGPMGVGPMSGRGMGYCAGFTAPGWVNPMPGRGRGMGRGWGRRGYVAMGSPFAPPAYGVTPYGTPPSTEQEVRGLKAQADQLEGTLDEIRKRLTELEAIQEKEG